MVQKNPSLKDKGGMWKRNYTMEIIRKVFLPVTETETYIIGRHFQALFKKGLQSI
jgi:hypothetical protein